MAGKGLVAGVVVLIVLVAAGLFIIHQKVEPEAPMPEVEQVTAQEFEEIDSFLAELEDYIAFENTAYDFEMEDIFGVE
jgi:hypothetical protein